MAQISIIRMPDVKARTGLSRSSIYSFIKSDSFPQHVSLGGKRDVGWVSSEIDAWIEARVTASRKAV